MSVMAWNDIELISVCSQVRSLTTEPSRQANHLWTRLPNPGNMLLKVFQHFHESAQVLDRKISQNTKLCVFQRPALGLRYLTVKQSCAIYRELPK